MTTFYLMVVLVAGCGLWSRAEAQHNAAIILPDRFMQPPSPKIITTDQPACASSKGPGGGYPCVSDPEYDDSVKNFVNLLLRRDDMVNELVNDPILSNILNDSPTPGKIDSPILNTRFGGTTETPVCAAQEMLIYPNRGKTPKGEWLFVVNQDNVRQAIKVEVCISEGLSCNMGMELPSGSKTSCRQKYVYRRMLTVSTNKLQPEELLMPSCCVCYISQNNFDISSRVGNGNTTNAGAAATGTDTPVPAAAASPPANSVPNFGSNIPVAFPGSTSNAKRAVTYDRYPFRHYPSHVPTYG